MSNSHATSEREGLWRDKARNAPTPLTLLRTVPSDWQYDRPAYAGDPFMDWESQPEPPRDAVRMPESPKAPQH